MEGSASLSASASIISISFTFYVSLLFPKLKKNVKEIDIIEALADKEALPSNDDGVAKSYFDVKMCIRDRGTTDQMMYVIRCFEHSGISGLHLISGRFAETLGDVHIVPVRQGS